MQRKTTKYSFIIILVILAGAILFAYREYNRKHDDVADMTSAFTLNSDEIVAAFSADEKAANSKYLDKVLSIHGVVKNIEKDELGANTVSLGNSNSAMSVRCSLDSTHNDDAKKITRGQQITVKGVCTGFNADELLGSDVILNRCSIIK
jgi:predicted negative regulator of RcsB-dependent stress response